VYVDDLIVTGGDPTEIVTFKRQMTSEFDMSDLGLLSFYLGLEVDQKEDYIAIRQTSYAKKVLAQFGMSDCNSTKVPMDPGTKLDADKQGKRIDATEYRRVIGCLRYLLHTRPDLFLCCWDDQQVYGETYCEAYACSEADTEISERDIDLWVGLYPREER